MRPHIDPASLASARGSERLAMLAHVRDCAACREAVWADDPTALFGMLALSPVPARVLNEVATEVSRRAGRDRRSGVVLAFSAAPRRAAAAAAAALVLLTGYATLSERFVPDRPLSVSSRRADVDVQSGRGVSQVIDLTVGETQIVMVYNGELSL